MAITTNVPQPNFSDRGFIAPSEQDILTGVCADMSAAFALVGKTLNLDPKNTNTLNTPQGQLASSWTAEIGNVNDTFLLFTQMFDPQYSFGRYQDALARIYFLERNPSQPTILQVQCIGLPGVEIRENALIIDRSRNNFICTLAGVIGVNGTVTLPFACLIPGPVGVPDANGIAIFSSVPGWDDATVISGVLGVNVESRAAFETRRAASVALNSVGALGTILARVLQVPGVLDALVIDNKLNVPNTIGGYTLQANSLYVGVVGGDPEAIAEAIWRGALSCAYNGNTTITIYDQNAAYNPPYPAYQITFEIPPFIPVLFNVVIANSLQVPSDASTQIQNAIIGAFAGLDGGPRARMGARLLASRFYAPVSALGPWAQIIDILIGSQLNPSAIFTASILTNQMTVSAVPFGLLAIGQTVFSSSSSLSAVAASTKIISQSSGTTGGPGVYVVSGSQTVASEQMVSCVASLFSIQFGIAQEPSVAAADIVVTLS